MSGTGKRVNSERQGERVQSEKWPLPRWIADLPSESERRQAQVRYYLNIASAFATESGHVKALSEKLGLGLGAVSVARKRGKVSPEMAVRIENLLGRDHFPRELFNDIFAVAE